MPDLLAGSAAGERVATARFEAAVYEELKRLAASLAHRHGEPHADASSIVHDAYVRLIGSDCASWEGRTHFFAVGSRVVRNVLVDRARRRLASKRGGHRVRLPLDECDVGAANSELDVLDVHDALERLARIDGRQARVVEQRVFGGLEFREIAHALGVSVRTVESDWHHGRVWMARELVGGRSGDR